jgi:excisionase family DNA binding protein
MIERRWMRVPEAAVYASAGVSWIRSLIKSGQLRAVKTGPSYIIERADLDACLAKLKSKAARRA